MRKQCCRWSTYSLSLITRNIASNTCNRYSNITIFVYANPLKSIKYLPSSFNEQFFFFSKYSLGHIKKCPKRTRKKYYYECPPPHLNRQCSGNHLFTTLLLTLYFIGCLSKVQSSGVRGPRSKMCTSDPFSTRNLQYRVVCPNFGHPVL